MSVDGRRVLVTDAHANPALAAVRSLGARGVRVTVVAEEGRLNLAGASRYADRVVVLPSSAARPVEYAEALTRELQELTYDLLLPVTDTTVAIVDHHRERFEQLTSVALPGSTQLQYATDKLATLNLARTVDVAVPPTSVFDTCEAALAAADALSYPCVIKPRFSRRWTGGGPVKEGRVRFVSSPAAFRTVYPALHRDDAPLVQQFVPGFGAGVFALVDRGRVLTTFVHRRLREVSPTGGPASLAESLAASDRLVQPAHRLLERAEWHGVAMVEFKDPGDARPPMLMEVNGRLWGSLPLAIASGVDFPFLVAQLFLGESPSVPDSYRVGVRCRHLRGDLSHIGGVMRGRPDGWPEEYPGRLRTLAAIAPWPGRWVPYNMRLGDPWPAVVESWRYIKDELRAATARVGNVEAAEARR